MKHQHYYEVTAGSHRELGEKLGELFGPIVRARVKKARVEEVWNKKLPVAEKLLGATRKYFPQYMKELEGYAAAAGIPLLDLWILSLEDELDWLAAEKCTTVVTNGGKLIIHNEDWVKDQPDDVCVVKKTIGSLTALELYYYNTPLGGGSISANSSGYVQAVNSLSHADHQVGVPRNVIARWLADTADLAGDIKKLTTTPRSSGYNHIFVNLEGEVVNLETSATKQVVTKPQLPHAHTNHYLNTKLMAFETKGPEANTFNRHVSACALMKDSMTVVEAMDLGNDTTQGVMKSIMNERTIGKAIFDLEHLVAKVWLLREPDLGWIDYPIDFMVGK